MVEGTGRVKVCHHLHLTLLQFTTFREGATEDQPKPGVAWGPIDSEGKVFGPMAVTKKLGTTSNFGSVPPSPSKSPIDPRIRSPRASTTGY